MAVTAKPALLLQEVYNTRDNSYMYYYDAKGETTAQAMGITAYVTTVGTAIEVVSYGFTVSGLPETVLAVSASISPTSFLGPISTSPATPPVAVIASSSKSIDIVRGQSTNGPEASTSSSPFDQSHSQSPNPTLSGPHGLQTTNASKAAVPNFWPSADANGTYPDGTYICKATVSGSDRPSCSLTSSSNSPNAGLKAGVGVLAALFILALGGFLFLLFRRRRHNDIDHHSAPFIAPPSDSSHASDAEKLRTRIAALEQQLAAAQTTLLATAVSMPTPIDDRTIASRFDGLAQEIKDWSLTHLRRNPGPHEFSPDLRELLRVRVPDYERLLTIPKTRGLVVRAAVSAILADAFEDGYLFPGGTEVRAVEKGMRKNMSDSDFNSWRCSTYASIAASFGNERDFLPALEPLAQRIDALVAPFADAQESSGRLKYLHRILYTFVTLSLTLLSQPARFHILDPKPPPTFDCRTMDDVLQENETKYSNTGRPENPLQGRQCSAVVFPGVEKWGNGQLGLEAEWESLIVVVKARVLV